MAEALTIKNFEYNPMTAMRQAIVKHSPKVIWLTREQMLAFATCFTGFEWDKMGIHQPGKFGIYYFGTEILMNGEATDEHHDEVEFKNGQPVPVEKKS